MATQIGTSNGMINIGHIWVVYVEESLKDLNVTNVISIHNDMPTSYEIVWAIARTVPRRAYFEFLDHPAVKVAYTFSLEMAANKGAENSDLRIIYGLGIKFPRLSARNSASIGAM